MSESTPSEQPLSARPRVSALQKARRRLSLLAQQNPTDSPSQSDTSATAAPQATSAPVDDTPPPPPTPPRPISVSQPPPSSYRPTLHDDSSDQQPPKPPQRPPPPPPPLPLDLPTAVGDPTFVTDGANASATASTHPPVPSAHLSSELRPRSTSTAASWMATSAADNANLSRSKSTNDKPLPRIVKHKPTMLVSPQPIGTSPVQPPSQSPLLSPNGTGGRSSPSGAAGDQRSLPPTPHTPQSPSPQTTRTNSRPTSTSSAAGLGLGLPTGSGDLDTSAMGRRGTGNGAGNGRLSPASAHTEHQRRARDSIAFQEPLRSSSPSPTSSDLKKPTEERPEQPSTQALVMNLTQQPYFYLFCIACVGLWIVTFGWKRFLTFLGLVAGPLIGRYVIPLPKSNTSGSDDEWPPKSSQADSVAWVNHALRTLFPLVSTDVLTPFVDLLEDALMEQVPPIVTSVRISSVSLGIEPVLLTSMKPISDDQWFAALAQPGASNGTVPGLLHRMQHEQSHYTGVPTPPNTAGTDSGRRVSMNNGRRPSIAGSLSPTYSTFSGSGAHHQGVSPHSFQSVPSPKIHPVSPRLRRARSSSIASKGSTQSWAAAADAYPSQPNSATPFDGAQQQLRKRDYILSRLKRHRGHPRHTHLDPLTTAAVSALCEIDGGDIDLDSDQYVNYEVGFTYRHSADMRARGSGIHMISHFGWGVRGLGGSEIPVYLSVAELKGKLRVRILLSASPPFAREISFSFVSMPEFNISARPLRSGSFNAMDIPMIKSYVEKSIAKVAGGFVSPKSYTMDVERLLMGQDSQLRAQSVGVFHIIIHNAHNLPRTDTVGSCDPYLAISYSKFNKPLFSTRTIVDTTDPVWEEEAFILVPADAVTAGEKLRLRVCDSDRFSADDLVGVADVDVTEQIVLAADNPGQMPFERQDVLQAIRPGMKVQGEIEWSIRFHPLWQMSKEELQKRVKALRETRGEGSTPAPWWLEWLDKYVEVPEWERERSERRKEHMDLFTGERMRDEVEAAGKPRPDFPSGVLQFHIHQCADLEVESLQGTFSGSASRRKSAAMGKPALQDVIDRGAADNYDPPSTYCEVHLNDKFVYRTRTKQLTPVPYFNAMSERFIRDWREAKITFVIKDARDREHDPILGVVCLQIKDVLKDASQVTQWYPLVGGLGWGRLRISLLFKPFDLLIPTNMSSYETATFDLKTVSTTTDMFELAGGKFPTMMIESEYDRAVLRCTNGVRTSDDRDRGERQSHEVDGGEMMADEFGAAPDGYDVPSRQQTGLSVAIPPSGRRTSLSGPLSPSGSSSISRIRGTFKRRRETFSSTLTKHHTKPIDREALLAMHEQNEQKGEVGWHTAHVHRSVRLAVQYRHSCTLVLSFVTKRVIKKRKVHATATVRLDDCKDGEVLTRTVPIFATASVRDAMKAMRKFNEARKFSAASADRLSRDLGNETPLVGYATLTFVVHAGLSRAHAKLAKRDLRFRSVYQAWEATRVVHDVEHMQSGSPDTDACDSDMDSDMDSDSDSDGNGTGNGNGDGNGDGDGDGDDDAHAAAARLRRDDTREMLQEHGSHGKALRDQNRGIFQLKLARTGKFVKDKVEAKLLSASAGGVDRRPRGMDLEVEHEGQSKL